MGLISNAVASQRRKPLDFTIRGGIGEREPLVPFEEPAITIPSPVSRAEKPVTERGFISKAIETVKRIAKTPIEVGVEPPKGEVRLGLDIERLKGAGRFIRDVAREIPRSVFRVALEITDLTRLTTLGEIQTKELGGRFGEAVLGEEPIKKFKAFGEETLLAFGAKKDKAGKFALPVGVVFTLVDFVPGGKAGKGLLKSIARADKLDEVLKLIDKLKVFRNIDEADKIKVAKNLVGKRTVADVSRTIDDFSKSVVQAGKSIQKGVDPFAKIKKERGFITSVKEAAPTLRVSGQYIPRSTDGLSIKARNLVLDDLVSAERMALTGTDDSAVAVGAELLKHYADEALRATDKAVKGALDEKAANLANSMARRLTEQGRSIQAASILGRLTPEGQLRFAAREIQKYNEGVEKIKGGLFGLRKKVPELTDTQARAIITEMKAIEKMEDGVEKAMRFQRLQNSIFDLVPSKFYDKMVAVWKAGLLTGIKTSGLNIFSNVSHFGSEIAKDVPAKVIDSVASLITGKKTIGLTMKGVWGGVNEGFGKGLRYLRTGFDERNIGAKLDWKRVNFGKGKVAKGLQKYETTVFRIMGAEDQPFYYGAKARSLHDQAKARALNKGLRGDVQDEFIKRLVANPTDNMVRHAVLDAETAVYQNRTVLGNIARQIQKAPGGEIVVPFGRTPSAVAQQIINYSPVGIVNTIIRSIGRGKFDQRLFAQGIGRGLTGTAALVIGGHLYNKGLIALDYPKGEREQKLWELEGKKPNTIKIVGKWRSPIVLGPMGNLLLIGGHFKNEFSQSGSPTEAFGKAVGGSAKSFTEQTFLTGVNRTVAAINDPERSAEGYFGSLLSSTVPTIVSDIARSIDEQERRAVTIPERVKLRVPGLRETLEPRVDVFGGEVERAGNIFETMADPTRPSRDITTPLVEELRSLADGGFNVSPTLLGDKKGYDILTKQENTTLWKRAGQITEAKLTNLIELERYITEADDLKAKMIDTVTRKSKVMARAEMVVNLVIGLDGDELKNKLSELKNSGLMTREVFNEYLKIR